MCRTIHNNVMAKVPFPLRLQRWYKNVARFIKFGALPMLPKPPHTHVVQFGDPVLREISYNVPKELIKSRELENLIYMMKRIMKKKNVYSMSAIQIGIPLRVIALQFPNPHTNLDFTEEEIVDKGLTALPLQIWINPTMDVTDYRQTSFQEQCLSIRGIGANVIRYDKVHLSGFNEKGEPKTMEASKWNARMIQHEMDHLNGILFTDNMVAKSLVCPHWEMVNRFRGHYDLSYN